jgi:NTE family protein
MDTRPLRLCAALFACCLALPAPAEAPSAPRDRPRIGLVLGGGGALGAAHAGVLKVLDELRVPVECIAGTSMGALVGGAYAAGMDGREVDAFLRAIDWQRIFGQEQKRRYQPMSVKRENVTISNKLEFGLGEDGLIAPRGLIETQQVESLIRNMVASQSGVLDFDRLPIPFRAVATDLRSGDMVVFRSGDLPTALRASMSVPGVFAPVELGDLLLVDGGIRRNLPVDVARETCADVVIAVAVAGEERSVESMRSATGSLGRMVDILIKGNERASLASLGPGDVGIAVRVDGMTSADFQLAPQAIDAGERAARALAPRLAALALPEEAYAAWRASHSGEARPAERRVASVEFAGVDARVAGWLASRVRTRNGDPVDEAVLAEDALRIYATGAYEAVGHAVTGPPDAARVVFTPVLKSWGPTFVSFDYGLETSLGGNPMLLASALLRRTWPEAGGREWRGLAQLGRETRLETDLRENFGASRRLFVLPRVGWYDQREDVFADNERVAAYDERGLYAELRAGVELGSSGEAQVGLFRRNTDLLLDIGVPPLSELKGYDDGGYLVEYERDTRDSDLWATRGSRQRLEFQAAETALGAESRWRSALVEFNESLALDRALLFMDLAGGTSFGTAVPFHQLFRLGGPGALSGLEYGALRGAEFAYLQAGAGWRLVDVDPLLGMTLYAGGALEAGNVWESIDPSSPDGLRLGGRLFLGGNTPFGPVSLSLGYVDSGDFALFLGLGRPVMSRWR